MAITLSKFELIRTEEDGQKVTTKLVATQDFQNICH